MGAAILIGWAALFIVLGGVFYLVTIYNSLIRLQNDTDKAWANINVLLQQRHDELPKLIETCKGYMQYEQKTLQAVTEARTAFAQATSVAEKAQADTLVSGAIKSLFAVAENYPDLKADANFLQLQGRITALEDKLAAQRTAYNQDVNAYNIRLAQFPSNFVAGGMSLQPHPLLQVAATDQEDVKVSFS